MKENPQKSYHNEDEEDNVDEIKHPLKEMTFDEHEEMFQFTKNMLEKLDLKKKKKKIRYEKDQKE
ncbi:hypothetical protein MKX01_005745 [Papaver californicum]|nr:hypothetical protein MKX01_005745 [Papaver californicum]